MCLLCNVSKIHLDAQDFHGFITDTTLLSYLLLMADVKRKYKRVLKPEVIV